MRQGLDPAGCDSRHFLEAERNALAHFGFICVPQTGHVSPMAALAHELVRRGHSATFVHHPDVEPMVRRLGLDFFPIGRSTGFADSLDVVLRRPSRVRAAFGLPSLIRGFARETAMLCEELPAALRALSIDMIVGDWIEAASGLVAHHMGLPYVSVAAALPLNWEEGVPSPYVGWTYGETRWHRARNVAAHYVAVAIQSPLHDVIRSYSERWRLGPKRKLEECASGYAQIAQLTPSLDYPRRSLIGCFHYCGPLRGPAKTDGATPGRRGSGRAFASLGSLQGHRIDIFERIADAAAVCGLDLTIAHGGRLAPVDAERLSRHATVHDFVSYDSIFQETDVAIMHGGMNGVLDALAQGVPLVTIPLAFEQPAIASRVRHAGAGLVCRPRALRRRLAGAIRDVYVNPSYAEAAARLRDEIRSAGGVFRAADVVEQVARTSRPCLNAEAVSSDPELAPYALGARP